MKETCLNYSDAIKICRQGYLVARKDVHFDGYIKVDRGHSKLRRVVRLNKEYTVAYETTAEDVQATDWYIVAKRD